MKKQHFVDWNNLNKIRLKNNNSEQFNKHEIVKLLIVRHILIKNINKRNHHFIYTEYKFNGRIADIYHYNRLTDEEIVYELQTKISKDWLEGVKNYYKNLDIDLIIVDLNKLSDNIKELNKQIKELII